MNTLRVVNLGQIADATVDFGDLTILVGPQAAGKSLILQTWKLAIDSGEVVASLRDAGYALSSKDELIDAYYGEGMRAIWTLSTEIRVDGQRFSLDRVLKSKSAPARVYFVPAHRALLMSEGWPAPFMRLKADTPTVARLFSQNLYERFTGRSAGDLFPVKGRLKESIRRLINDAVFHGGRVKLEKAGLQTRLELQHGDAHFPFMTWTAGQREFTPLLLGLYSVLPAQRNRKDPRIEWVIIEEPEMGLHPQALNAVLALVLDLLWRGYRVVLSTHSPFVLDVVFALRELRDSTTGVAKLREAFGLPARAEVNTFLQAALKKSARTFALLFGEDGRVRSRDISELDPASDEDAVREWGGLTGFSSRFAHAIADAAAEAET